MSMNSAARAQQAEPAHGALLPAAAAPSTVPAHTDPHGAQTAARETPWSYYWLVLRRHRWQILTFALVITAVATLVALTRPKQYRSAATVQIDAIGAQVLGDNALQRNTDVGSESDVLTEQTVMASPAVLLRAVEKLRLQDNPAFADPDHPGAAPSLDFVIKTLSKNLNIVRPVGALLLQAEYTSRDANLSAEVANAVAQSYLDLEYNSRGEALSQSTQYMSGQLDTLRAQMEKAQKDLVDYESRADILDPDSKDNIMVARLSQLNEDLTKAQNDRMRLGAAVRVVQLGKPDLVASTEWGQSLVPLRATLAADQRQLSALGQVYGPKHPRYQQQASQVRQDEALLGAEEMRISLQIQSEYQAALTQERFLSSALAEQKSAMDVFNLKAIQYRSLKAAADNYSKVYYDLLQGIAQSNLAAGFHGANVRIVNPARPDGVPVYPRPKLVAAMAFLGSLLLGIGLAVGWGMMDQSLATAEQIEALFGMHVLGVLPWVSERESARALALDLYAANAPGSLALPTRPALQESVLSLQSSIMLGLGGAPQVLAISSALPGEGKSMLASHLAAALASMGEKTVLVDADMRKPKVHRALRLSNRVGLSQLLQGTVSLDQALQGTATPLLGAIPAGTRPANPAELLHQRMGGLIEQLRERFDRVVVDCPPTLGFADTVVVANFVDALMLVVRAGKTDRSHVAGALRQLRNGGAEICGVVLNGVDASLNSYYTYQSAYAYYEHAPEDSDED